MKVPGNGQVYLFEAFVKVNGAQVWLRKCHIDEYIEGNQYNHDPARPRQVMKERDSRKELRSLRRR